MRRQIVPLLALTWMLGGAALEAATNQNNLPPHDTIQCNYDLTNKSGREVFDVELVLQGNLSFTGFYNAYFNNPPIRTVTANGNTSLHWMNPKNPILPNTLIHVGYTPVGTWDCPVIAIYWTDENHNRVSSSYIGTVYNHLRGTQQTLTNHSLFDVNVYDIRMACQAAPLPLDALNATNEYLAGAMVAIADAIVLAPGETWTIPVNVPCRNCYCVTNFKTSGEGLDAIFSPWVQEYVPE